MVLGNVIEPMWMGRKLGLSTVVVLLSLVVWYEIWGTMGALLSVPLTMVIKIMLENSRDYGFVATLLDSGGAAEPAVVESAPVVRIGQAAARRGLVQHLEIQLLRPPLRRPPALVRIARRAHVHCERASVDLEQPSQHWARERSKRVLLLVRPRSLA